MAFLLSFLITLHAPHFVLMNLQKAQEVLKNTFGYDSFRSLQTQAIQFVYDNQDAVVIMPTGGGKSLCYQIPAITVEGITLVISPLIALMKDQVEGLRANGISAAYINSSISYQEEMQLLDQASSGHLSLLYLSPEKFLTSEIQSFLRRVKLNLIAIDEAHCVSTWGHDFRPEYSKIGQIRKSFQNIPFLALTATADKATQQDIANQLQLINPKIITSSFERANLRVQIKPAIDRYKEIVKEIKKRPQQSGIIYCLSRKVCQSTAAKLQRDGYNADFYHAGMSAQDRNTVQEAFIKDDTQIICATIAFGMGIDKANIRWVIHHNMPKNLESYYQEIGRAGRDGLDSDCILYYSIGDLMTYQKFIDDSRASEQFKLVQKAKLDRMKQYCEEQTCRRNIVLSYFGEHKEDTCGTCDNCRNPPQSFNATIISQMAFSAVKRLKQIETMSMVIDVLRGAQTQTVLQKGYQQIKTYGVGKGTSAFEWRMYLMQLINQGYLELLYHEGSRLICTEKANRVLFEAQDVELYKVEFKDQKSKLTIKKSKTVLMQEALFEKLRKARKQLADQEQIAPYSVFNDNTLEEIAKQKPVSLYEMSEISGVGQHKLDKYGEAFINLVLEFIQEQAQEGNKVKGGTIIETLNHYKQGLSPQEIAAKRNLNIVTIFSHLVSLYEKKHVINIEQYITATEKEQLFAYLNTNPFAEAKTIFEHFKKAIPYQAIRVAIALYQTEG